MVKRRNAMITPKPFAAPKSTKTSKLTKPDQLFSSLALSASLQAVVRELGFSELTLIQAQSIPKIIEGRDLIGQSKTGSGKTAAFALPVLDRIHLRDRRIQAMVLCPTRELCTQVAREIRKLGRRHAGLQVLILSGGTPLYPQLTALEKGVHIVVGTPGRVLDLLNRKSLDLSESGYLVLDEADRMLEMGFHDDIEKIFKKTPTARQTVLFSATFPPKIESLSRAYQNKPVRVTIAEEKQTAPKIRQLYYEVADGVKLNGLLWLLQQYQTESAIVFCNLKVTVVDVAQFLRQAGVSSACLHGDLEQSERDRVMAKFRNKSTRILIATDVAARGIDVENLDAVFNFDFPARADVYVHRIGRTGRAGKTGLAVSLVLPREKGKVSAIQAYTGTLLEAKTLAKVEALDVQEFKKNLQQEATMTTLYISGGRKDKVRPGDLLGALTGEAGRLDGAQIGKIEIHDTFSYVAIDKAVAHIVIQRLRDGRIKGRKFRVELVR